MKIETMVIATFTITALTGQGTSQAVSSFVKVAAAKAGISLELRTAPLPDGADPALASWEVVLTSPDEEAVRTFATRLRTALLLLPVELSRFESDEAGFPLGEDR